MLEKFQSKKAVSEQIKQGSSYFLIKNNDEFIGYLAFVNKNYPLDRSDLSIGATQPKFEWPTFAAQILPSLSSAYIIHASDNCLMLLRQTVRS